MTQHSRESCVNSLLIFHQIPPCSSCYTKTQLPWTSNNSSRLFWQDFCVVTHKSCIGCRSRTTQRHPRSVAAVHSRARPLKTSPLQNQSFDLCVPHHAYASVTSLLLITKALLNTQIIHTTQYNVANTGNLLYRLPSQWRQLAMRPSCHLWAEITQLTWLGR